MWMMELAINTKTADSSIGSHNESIGTMVFLLTGILVQSIRNVKLKAGRRNPGRVRAPLAVFVEYHSDELGDVEALSIILPRTDFQSLC
jgi:hypothetical protein